MKAAVFHRIGQPLSVETVPDPTPGPGEVVLRVEHCGVCGSDLHWTITDGALSDGVILGHEFAGTVVAAGPGATLKSGTRVTALPMFCCWDCDDCNSGHHAHCTRGELVGLARPGAFAEYVVVEPRLAQRLPEGVSFAEGALVEPLAVAHRAISHAGPLAGRDVLILGAGPIGAAVTLFARQAGARQVIVSEPAPERRARALDLGAHAVIDPTASDPAKAVRALCGHKADVVIECVGLPGMIAKAIDYTRSRGRVVVVGVCMEPDTFMPMAALTREISLSFSGGYTVKDFEAVIDALARREIEAAKLITNKVPLAQAPAAFEALRRPVDQCKLLVSLA